MLLRLSMEVAAAVLFVHVSAQSKTKIERRTRRRHSFGQREVRIVEVLSVAASAPVEGSGASLST